MFEEFFDLWYFSLSPVLLNPFIPLTGLGDMCWSLNIPNIGVIWLSCPLVFDANAMSRLSRWLQTRPSHSHWHVNLTSAHDSPAQARRKYELGGETTHFVTIACRLSLFSTQGLHWILSVDRVTGTKFVLCMSMLQLCRAAAWRRNIITLLASRLKILAWSAIRFLKLILARG
jgi:hypothetical protein